MTGAPLGEGFGEQQLTVTGGDKIEAMRGWQQGIGAGTNGRAVGFAQLAGDETEDAWCARLELQGLAGLEAELLQCEDIALGEELIAGGRLERFRLEVVKVGAFERLLDVQLARGAVQPNTTPIVDTVGGVGILLNLEDQVAPRRSHGCDHWG